MSEILTESFCERCGTRYTFESPARRSTPLEALGTVGRGLRKFVASPDQSIDEAFAVARAETEQRTTAHQLEAFHRTFNFCLSCRQYTCGECWNPIEGRCQSCAPMADVEAPPDVIGATPEALTAAESVADSPVVLEAIAIARAAASPVLEAPEATEVLEPEPEVQAEALAEVELADEVDVEPDTKAEEVVELEPEPALDVAPEPEPEAPAAPMAPEAPVAPVGSLPAFPPGVSLDEEIAAYDLRVAALAVPPPPPPAIEPIAATSTPVSQAQMPAPTARVVPAAVPDLPAASEAAMPAAQAATSCPSCGLALSATARFCRRCGTAQAH